MGSHWNRVIAGVVALCVVALLLGGVMALLLYQTAASKDEVLLDEAQDLYRVQALYATSQRAAYLMRGYLLTGAPSMHAEQEVARQQFGSLREQTEAHSMNAQARELLREIRRASGEQEAEGQRIIALREQHLFEPFRKGAQTEKTVKASLGLGLYIVQQIVAAHGGWIDVRSKQSDSEGATFSVLLPRHGPSRA